MNCVSGKCGSRQNAPRRASTFARFPEEGAIPRKGRPLLAMAVPAGLPAPANDFATEYLSLDECLILNRDESFYARVAGHSMTGFGIHDGDLLLVDRAQQAVDRSVVIAVVDGQFTIKQLCRMPYGILLRSGASGHADILVSGDQELSVWGVVRWSIHAVCP